MDDAPYEYRIFLLRLRCSSLTYFVVHSTIFFFFSGKYMPRVNVPLNTFAMLWPFQFVSFSTAKNTKNKKGKKRKRKNPIKGRGQPRPGVTLRSIEQQNTIKVVREPLRETRILFFIHILLLLSLLRRVQCVHVAQKHPSFKESPTVWNKTPGFSPA